MRRRLSRVVSVLALGGGALAAWSAIAWLSGAPPYILPQPAAVLEAWISNAPWILHHAAVTASEILAGLVIGVGGGLGAALALSLARVRTWLLPALVASQAIPVFALAPLLVLWLGYGPASKIAMASLIIFFPVTAAFHDGLRRTDRAWLDMGLLMTAGSRTAGRKGRTLRVIRFIRIPAALPAAASGIRIAAAVAPIGAVVGEWVGSGAGLGYLMLHANGRMRIDLMFAALFTLTVMAVALYATLDVLLRRALPWQPDTQNGSP